MNTHHPIVGEAAPWIKGLTDHSGKTVSLDDFSGRWKVVYFYPRDQTEGCVITTYEIASTPDEMAIIAVSLEGIDGQREFLERNGDQFICLADSDGALRRKYGLESLTAGTSHYKGLHHAFLISSDGRLMRTWSGVDTRSLWQDLRSFIAGSVP